MDVPRVAEGLYALPPSRFVAERDALARALAAKGDPAAVATRKLPRPVGLAWVLNRLARERAEDVQALLAAGDRLRAGQRRALAGRGADELRGAEQELRDRARTLRSEGARILAADAKPGAPAALARLELLLRVAASGPGPAREALRRGTLAREPEIATGELSGFTVVAGGARAAAAAPATRRESAREARTRAARERRDRRERERQLTALRRAAARTAAEAERAEREAKEAGERARGARERAAKAREEAARARRRLSDAERGG